MISQTLAKGFALCGPSDRFLKADSRISLHGGRHAHALAVEVGHDDLETFVFGANQIGSRHSDLVKVEGGGIRGPPSHFAIQGSARETLGIGGNQEH